MVRTPYGECWIDTRGRTMWSGDLIGPAHQTAGGVWVISDRDQVELLRETLMDQELTGIDTEYDGVDRADDASPIGNAHIVCAQFSWPDPLLGPHPDHPDIVLAQRTFFPNFGQAEDEDWLSELRPWFVSADHGKCGSFVFSTEWHVFHNHGIQLNGIQGCGVRQSQVWRTGRVYQHGLKPLGKDDLRYEMRDFDEVFSTPKLKKDGQPYANDQKIMIPLKEAFSDPDSAIYASGVDYSSLDAKVSREGDHYIRGELRKMQWRGDATMEEHYDRKWNPYQYIVAGMEDAGWAVSTEWFDIQREKATDDQAQYAELLNQWAGLDSGVKWSSAPQKQHFLYGKGSKVIAGNTIIGKGLPISPVCKSGGTLKWNRNLQEEVQALSTDATAVQWVRDHAKKKEDKEGLVNLLKWTKVNTLLQNFLRPFPKWVTKWGVIHSRIGPETETSRLTVRKPPLQTLPVAERDPYSIREGLTAMPERWDVEVARHMHAWRWSMAEPGHNLSAFADVDPDFIDDNLVLIGLDYSQLEMRILAHYLVVLFNNFDLANDLAAGDLHAATALRVWGNDPILKGLTPWDIKNTKNPLIKLFRNRGKIINFSVNYGKTEVGLGFDIRDENGEPIGVEAARAILHQYFAAYPAILRYHKWAKQYVYANGYMRSLGGGYRFLPDIRSPARGKRGEAERAALNTPIQKSAADIVMEAMLRSNSLPIPDLRRLGYFDEELYDYGARLVMQIHDELVWRVPWRYAEPAMTKIKYHMERPFDPELPGFIKSGLPLPVEGSIGVTYLETK